MLTYRTCRLRPARPTPFPAARAHSPLSHRPYPSFPTPRIPVRQERATPSPSASSIVRGSPIPHERLHAPPPNVNAPTSSTFRVVPRRQNARNRRFMKNVHENVEYAGSADRLFGALERVVLGRVCGAQQSRRAARRCGWCRGRSVPCWSPRGTDATEKVKSTSKT